MGKRDIITIDGPAGSGKSTAARGLAGRLGIRYFNSGALYRAIAHLAASRGVDLADTRGVVELVRRTKFETRSVDGTEHVFLDGADVTEKLFQNDISRRVYLVADPPEIRREVGRLARELNAGTSFVTEGRDQGTEVFPEARVKFFLDARAEVRAERRRAELEGRGEAVSREELLKQILERDRRDRSRPVGALRPAADAVVLDNSDMTVDGTVEALYRLALAKLGTN